MANEKHIFIGIGGAGCQTVAQVKQKVYENLYPTATKAKGRMESMNETYRFLFLDTDSRDIDEKNKKNRETFEEGRVLFINPQTDLVNLGNANPKAIYYEAKQQPNTMLNKRILEACSDELAAKMPDMPLAFGAGAFRMKSRISFAHSLTDFQNKFRAAIGALNDIKSVGGEQNTIFYWVVGSSCGGTGSGIINDVLYHVNMIHKQVVGDGDPLLFLTMYMPAAYIERNHTEEKYSLNAYAVLNEMEAFKVMGYNEEQNKVMHRMAFMSDYNLIDQNRAYSPFKYMVPVDIQTDQGTNFGNPRTMYRNTSELLYHMHAGQGGKTHRSNMNNYIDDIIGKNPKNFCVPMGYVALRKPTVEFNNYFISRFKKDIIGTWLLNPAPTPKGYNISTDDNDKLKELLFKTVLHSGETTLAYKKNKKEAIKKLKTRILSKDEEINDKYTSSKFESEIRELISPMIEEEEGDDRATANTIKLALWKVAESKIKEKGLCYTLDLLDSFRKYLKEQDGQNEQKTVDEIINNSKDKNLRDLEAKAGLSGLENLIKSLNKEEVQTYYANLERWMNTAYEMAENARLGKYMRNLYEDDNKCEIVILKNRLSRLKDKADEISLEAREAFNKLAFKCNEAKNDVTTVYLPMLKKISDGNGWIKDNFFSKCYKEIIESDVECNADRACLVKMIDEKIYAPGTELEKAIHQASFYVMEKNEDGEDKAYTRFFAIPSESNMGPQKVIEEFSLFCTKVLVDRMENDEKLCKIWKDKGIYSFFRDLTNDEKDEVRRALNPALFFSYNSNDNALQSRSEPMIFVAKDEDLARDMLGFNKSNPVHRFEEDSNADTALVLREKIGLSLHDYRVYDDLERVYNQASFREKYHFHRDFAQYGQNLTLDKLPDNVQPEHYTFVKMMILQKYEKLEDYKKLFYKDKYDQEIYHETMFFEQYADVWRMAHQDAFGIAPTGQLCMMFERNGHELYEKIVGKDFCTKFEYYSKHYQSLCFGDTLRRLLMAILSYKNGPVEGSGTNAIVGESILYDHFPTFREELLREWAEKKRSGTPDEKRLWNIFYEILRDQYEIANDFIEKNN